MTAKNGRRKAVDAETFVREWQKAGTMAEVIKATGLKRTTAYMRAFAYRRAGIPLKPLTHGNKLDVPALSALAEKLAPKA